MRHLLTDVAPPAATDYVAHHRLADAILGCERFLADGPRRIANADFLHLGLV